MMIEEKRLHRNAMGALRRERKRAEIVKAANDARGEESEEVSRESNHDGGKSDVLSKAEAVKARDNQIRAAAVERKNRLAARLRTATLASKQNQTAKKGKSIYVKKDGDDDGDDDDQKVSDCVQKERNDGKEQNDKKEQNDGKEQTDGMEKNDDCVEKEGNSNAAKEKGTSSVDCESRGAESQETIIIASAVPMNLSMSSAVVSTIATASVVAAPGYYDLHSFFF